MNKTLVFSAILFFAAATIFARPTEFIREYTYFASEFDSRVTARNNASDQMHALLLREIGQVVISEQRLNSESRNNEFIYENFTERITAITASMVGMEILNETWDGQRFHIRARMIVDPSEVSRRANEILMNMNEMRALENEKREIMQQVENLNRELSGQRVTAQRNENFLFDEINEHRAQNNNLIGQIGQLRRENSQISARYSREISQRDSAINALNLQLAALQQAQTVQVVRDTVFIERPTVAQRTPEREARAPDPVPAAAPAVLDEIVITTTPPGALIFVNDDFVARTPHTIRDAPQGRIAIRVRATGFEPHVWDINYRGARLVLDKSLTPQTAAPSPAAPAPQPVQEAARPVVREGVSTISRQEMVRDESLLLVSTGGVSGNSFINVSINRIFVTRMNPNARQNFVLINGQHTMVLSYIRRDGTRWVTLDERTVTFTVSSERTTVWEVSTANGRIRNVEQHNLGGLQFAPGSVIRLR